MSEETLAQILAAIPEEQRFILTLHYVKGLPQKEIAKTLGVPERAVATVIVSGKSRLLGLFSADRE
jgi:RNA polymerase sigma factor (sigma-70 family)